MGWGSAVFSFLTFEHFLSVLNFLWKWASKFLVLNFFLNLAKNALFPLKIDWNMAWNKPFYFNFGVLSMVMKFLRSNKIWVKIILDLKNFLGQNFFGSIKTLLLLCLLLLLLLSIMLMLMLRQLQRSIWSSLEVEFGWGSGVGGCTNPFSWQTQLSWVKLRLCLGWVRVVTI